MKLKIDTPMASAPIVAAESAPQCPAMAVDTMPMSGTVMFETILGSAMRSISRFMFMESDGEIPGKRRRALFMDAKITQKRRICNGPCLLSPNRVCNMP